MLVVASRSCFRAVLACSCCAPTALVRLQQAACTSTSACSTDEVLAPHSAATCDWEFCCEDNVLENDFEEIAYEHICALVPFRLHGLLAGVLSVCIVTEFLRNLLAAPLLLGVCLDEF